MHLGPWTSVPSPVSVASIAAPSVPGRRFVWSSPSGFLFFPDRDAVLRTKEAACQNCTQCLPGFCSFSVLSSPEFLGFPNAKFSFTFQEDQ